MFNFNFARIYKGKIHTKLYAIRVLNSDESIAVIFMYLNTYFSEKCKVFFSFILSLLHSLLMLPFLWYKVCASPKYLKSCGLLHYWSYPEFQMIAIVFFYFPCVHFLPINWTTSWVSVLVHFQLWSCRCIWFMTFYLTNLLCSIFFFFTIFGHLLKNTNRCDSYCW